MRRTDGCGDGRAEAEPQERSILDLNRPVGESRRVGDGRQRRSIYYRWWRRDTWHHFTNNSFNSEALIFHVSKWLQVHAALVRGDWSRLQSSTSSLLSHPATTEPRFNVMLWVVQDQNSQTLNINVSDCDGYLYHTRSSHTHLSWADRTRLSRLLLIWRLTTWKKGRKFNEISVLHSPLALHRLRKHFLKCCLSDVPCSLITGPGLWRPFAELLLFCLTTFSIFHRLAFMNRLWSVCEASL